MNTIFKTGMPVWDRVRHPGIQGVVEAVNAGSNNLIKVRFGDVITLYNSRGDFSKGGLPTLSVVDYEFELPPQVIPYDFKKYDLVLVKDFDKDTWELSVLDKILEEDDFTYLTVYGQQWRYCMPFDQETYENQ